MVYRISLIEFGRVSHSWQFTEIKDALRMMECLCYAFDEVNEVFPILVKCTPAESTHKLKGFLNNLIIE